jgi:hypothetical protein
MLKNINFSEVLSTKKRAKIEFFNFQLLFANK